jgi:branched-subunit amino acid ABC-type transport system permease component
MVVLQVIIEGLATGTVYAGLALALVLVYRMNRRQSRQPP